MKDSTRITALEEIRRYCPSKVGFELAFANTTWPFIHNLIDCIYYNTSISRSTYDEPLDFLDGNGFIVEGNEVDGYTIKPM